MSSRSEGKKAAREARLAAEQEESERARRQRIWALAGGSVLLAAIVIVALIVLSSGDSGDEDGDGSGNVALFDGIPQSGTELGDPKAPVTLVEFADMQCPFCADYTADALPGLISDYVESGDLRMELNLLAFIGPDSEVLARAAYAASEQNLMWQFTDVAYAQQGAENSGFATDEFVASVAEQAGADVEQMNEAVESEAVTSMLEDAQSAASDAGVDSTPSFLVGPTGGDLEPVDQQDLSSAIEEQIAAAG